ncbi:MAG: hypothetical protein KC656_18855 [Myxococcales bacterium]|nr:hypothetical protein [Myxococcales bacterium]
MSRILPLALLALAACNKPLASERDSVFPTMRPVTEQGPWIALFAVSMGVDADSRPLDAELEMNVGGFLEEGTTVDAVFTSVLLEPLPTSEPGAHTGDVAIQILPDFTACDGIGYTEREDGGCTVDVVATVTLSTSGSPRVGFIARVQETDGWTGSADSIQIDLEVTEVTE